MADAPSLLDRRLLIVTGKGGVGKTAIASALAVMAASAGRRTLVCEIDAKGGLAATLESEPLEFEPREIQPNLFAMSMDTEASLKEYLSLQLRLPLVARVGPLARSFDFLANAAPGVKEILTIGKLCWEVKERHYDLVIADAAASGHVVGQLAAADSINELVSVGLVRSQTDWMLQILKDPAVTGTVVVAAPEEMPVTETLELVEQLDTETEVDVAAVVANRVLPALFSRSEADDFERLDDEEANAPLAAVAGEATGAILEAAHLARSLRRNRAGHLERLATGLGPDIPLVYVPELFLRTHGIRATSRIAEHLEMELGQ